MPNRCSCEAADAASGESLGRVVVSISREPSALIQAAFSANPSKDFKIGRRFVAGRDLTASSALECRFLADSGAQNTVIAYFCGSPPLPENYSALRELPLRSLLAFRNEPAPRFPIRICRTFLSCFDLRECR